MPWIGTGIIVAGATKRGNSSGPLAGLGMNFLADEANVVSKRKLAYLAARRDNRFESLRDINLNSDTKTDGADIGYLSAQSYGI